MTIQDRRRDLAARAGWLYYIAGNTQDEIAGKPRSLATGGAAPRRPGGERKLIKFRLDHRFSNCIERAEALRSCFDLSCCEISPGDERLRT
ncbi:MAG: hypothetical protein R3C97_02500 [Geminicoccaceae bacterium]